VPISLQVLIQFYREIEGDFSPTCGNNRIACLSSIRPILIQIRFAIADAIRLSFMRLLKGLSFKFMDKNVKFRHEGLIYSEEIFDQCRRRARMCFAEWPSNLQIPLTSAEFRGGIKRDRRK
jgi:hypothetical protein